MGQGVGDRDRVVASGTMIRAASSGEHTLPALPATTGWGAPTNDRLFTAAACVAAELSTMPLRWRPEGRCAASWITSEVVSGVGDRKVRLS